MDKRKLALILGGTNKPWYLAGNAPMPVSAFKATGTSTYAETLINLVNPGTLNLIEPAIPPVAWTTLNGWRFDENNTGGSLRTGITFADGDVTVFIRVIFGTPASAAQVFCGVYQDPGGIFYIQNGIESTLNFHAPNTISTTKLTPGTTYTLAIAGTKAYVNGVAIAGDLTKNAITSELFIGALNLVGTGPIQCCYSQITHFAYWNQVLTPTQIMSVTNAMSH